MYDGINAQKSMTLPPCFFRLCAGWLIAVTWAWCVGSVRANGGTFDTSTVMATGNLEPVQKNKIVLESEVLDVRIDGEFSNVTVTYQLRNRGNSDEVTYAFPVDMPSSAFPGKEADLEFSIWEGTSGRVPVQQVLRKESPIHRANPVEDEYYKPIRAWNVVSLSFAKEEMKQLKTNGCRCRRSHK